MSSDESELMALVGRACEGKPMEQDVQLLTWDDCAAHGQFSISGIRETQGCESTRHVDTKVYFMHSWAMEPGQRILKVHG